MASPQINFRAKEDDFVGRNLTERTEVPPNAEASEGVLFTQTAQRELARWYTLLPMSLPRFPMKEAMLIFDSLNGFRFEPQVPDTVAMNIADAISMDGLDQKWGVNGPALLKKLRQLKPFEMVAIVDAVERAWMGPYYRETNDLKKTLVQVGLAEPDLGEQIQDLNEMLEYTRQSHGFHSIEEVAQSLYSGETATILLPDEQRSAAAQWLFAQAEQLAAQGKLAQDLITAEALKDIAESLEQAIKREHDLDEQEMRSYIDQEEVHE